MKNKIPNLKSFRSLGATVMGLLLFCFILLASDAQSQTVSGAETTCKITVGNKTYTPKLNQLECFDRVANLPADATVSVVISYPEGNEGDKVIISAVDGGTLDNGKIVKVAQLDKEKKFSFSFRFIDNDPGIYRIGLHKGNDFKMVQLWQGPELPVAKK